MAKINSKGKRETKITDQGDILEDKSVNSRLSNRLYLADRGDAKKLLKSRAITDIRTSKCLKPHNTKQDVHRDRSKPDSNNILEEKNVITTHETKYKANELSNFKPIDVRSRVKTYIQNLKLYSDLKSKDTNLTTAVSNINHTPEKVKTNIVKVGINETTNLVQSNAKKTLNKMKLGDKSNEIRNKEVYESQKSPDSTVEYQTNEILKLKQNKEVLNTDKSGRINIKIVADERKKLKENISLKTKVSSNLNQANPLEDKSDNDKRHSNEIIDNKSVSTRTKDSLKKSESSRRPVVTTIRSKHNTKVYKAVTFTDLNQREPTPIEIKMPVVRRKEKFKSCDKITDIPNSSAEKNKKKHHKKRNVMSPDFIKKGESPPTEVAKWAPNCVNKHTIPYYEAWIDTTLAAVSKSSKKDGVLEKQNLLRAFKKFIERPRTPDLVYDRMDEKYTGKIKIKQKHK